MKQKEDTQKKEYQVSVFVTPRFVSPSVIIGQVRGPYLQRCYLGILFLHFGITILLLTSNLIIKSNNTTVEPR